MNNIKLYKILYYICFIVSILLCIFSNKYITYFDVDNITFVSDLLIFINIVLIILFSVNLFRKKLNKVTNLFPIIYLVFLIIISTLAIVMNNKLILPYIHYGYYLSFILFNYVLLNLYSILSFKK